MKWFYYFSYDPPFWVMPDQYIKYWILKLLRKKPIWNWEAAEWGEVVPGMGVYVSDGIYQSAYNFFKNRGFTPMWKENQPSYGEDR